MEQRVSPEYIQTSLAASLTLGLQQGSFHRNAKLKGLKKGFIDSGVNTIAYPLQGTMDYAKEIGLETRFIEMCCSLL